MDPSIPTPLKYKDMLINPLGNRQSFYDDFIESCQKVFGEKGNLCMLSEIERIEKSIRQPQSMQNYTDLGFKKIKAPTTLFSLIQEFWEKNKNNGQEEDWGPANTYTNNWEVSTDMVAVEDSGLRGGGTNLKQMIWDYARDVSRRIWKTIGKRSQSSHSGFSIYYRLLASGLGKN